MSLERDVEECIWGRLDWNEYAGKLVAADAVDERALLQRIELVKGNVGRQIRKAVEQHHPRLVEQASALHGLDMVQAAIGREMSHLYATSEQLSQRFMNGLQDLRGETLYLEQLYAMRRILFAATRCEQLVRRLNSVSELVKRSEMICELEAIVAETPHLRDVVFTRELILVTIPKIASEARSSTVKQLKSSMDTLHAPLVSSCVRALRNLSCYDVEVKNLLDGSVKSVDAQFLQLMASPESAAKLLLHLSGQVQNLVEQFSLLGNDVASQLCTMLAQTITNRVPENAEYASRVVQLFSKSISQLSTAVAQPIFDALQPSRTAVLSQSLSRMFQVVNSALDDSAPRSPIVEKINSVLREELTSVEWDAELYAEMEVNAAKAIELTAQKIEQRLLLDEKSLHMGERISNTQAENYNLMNVAYALSVAWPNMGDPLLRVAEQARAAVMGVARSSVAAILHSMHREELRSPSPYIKELCEYLAVLRAHFAAFAPFSSTHGVITDFVDYVVELFLVNATLVRPMTEDTASHLASDLVHVAHVALAPFNSSSASLACATDFARALCLTPEELAHSEQIPFWAAVQFLISSSEESLISPHTSAGWSIQEYVQWFMQQTSADRLHFFSSLMASYTSSVISQNCTEYVSTYPQIMAILHRVAVVR